MTSTRPLRVHINSDRIRRSFLHLLLHLPYLSHILSYHFTMSDQCRQSFTDKAASSLKVPLPLTIVTVSFTLLLTLQPDSQKSTTEHVGDKIKGTMDSIASNVQPEVRRLTLIITIRSNLGFRVRSPRASKSVTRSPVTTEKMT